jgi:hypothetical protein
MTLAIVERLRRKSVHDYGNEIDGGTLDEAANTIERMTEALEAVRAYYFLANPSGLTDAYVCDLVCEALSLPTCIKDQSHDL